MRLFEIDPDTQLVSLNKPWIQLIPEFNELLKRDKGSKGDYRGDKKLKATKEFTFIYHMVDFGSPLRDWNEDEKFKESLRYAELEESDIDEKVLIAKKHYHSLFLKAARSLRTYKSMLKAVDGMDLYFENLDFTQKDKKGELVNDPISVANTIAKMDNVYTAIKNFEKRVEDELKSESTGIRGTAELGDIEEGNQRKWSEQDIMSGSDAAKNETSPTSGTFQSMMLQLQEEKFEEDTDEASGENDDLNFEEQ